MIKQGHGGFVGPVLFEFDVSASVRGRSYPLSCLVVSFH